MLLLLICMLLQQTSGVFGHYNFVPREYRQLGMQNVGAHLAPPLQFHYYKKQCPQLGSVVKRVIQKYTATDPTTPAPLLRLFFHDCFVQGCDASLLLDSAKGTGEKEAPINFSIGNIEIVDEIKEVLEKECPGIVSCADVLALVAVYSIAQVMGTTCLFFSNILKSGFLLTSCNDREDSLRIHVVAKEMKLHL